MLSNLLKRWQVTWKPEVFQGWGKTSKYFEGWYFKLVSADQRQAIALIPGVSYAESGQHAFVQVMDGTKISTDYHRFEVDQFVPRLDRFGLTLDQNYFSSEVVKVNLPQLQGEIQMTNPVTWHGSLTSPGIMGWYSFVPFMQCYHGLVSINHELTGQLELNGTSIDFTGGKGYIEKDWGSSFPKSWIWTQCNHFDSESLSVMASVAHIPWLSSSFIGFLALVWDGEKIKIFTTYTGARMKAKVQEEQVLLSFRDRQSRLEIKAKMAPGVNLVSPVVGEMVGKINESLQAGHEIEYHKETGEILRARGKNAGLEVAPGYDILLSETWRK